MLKIFPGPGYFLLEDGVVWIWHSLVSLYIWLNILSCYGSINLNLGLIGREIGLITLCHSFKFVCHQKFLKTFPCLGYLRSKDEVVWLWLPLVNLYIWLTILSCYSWIPFTLALTGRECGLITLCNSCGFLCQKRMLKMFPGPNNLHFENGVVWLWHTLVNLYICLKLLSSLGSIPLELLLIGRNDGFSTLCHSCEFVCQKRVLKTFPGPDYLRSEVGVVGLWLSLVNLYI